MATKSVYTAAYPVTKSGVMHLTSDYKTRNANRPNHGGMDFTSLDASHTRMTTDWIVAMEKGVVISTGFDSSAGYYVNIKHSSGMISCYYHLKKGSIKVKKNQTVTRGQVLGYMGASGNANGAHIHIGIRNANWKVVDPQPYLKGTKSLLSTEPESNTYIVVSPRYVRTGAGTEYRIKKVAELTKDGQAHCVNKKLTADAQYAKGTPFTALDIVKAKNGSTWAKTPSGYVCLVSSKGKVYCKKK